jgi:hypothetical protein
MNTVEITLLVCSVAVSAALFAWRGPSRTGWVFPLVLAPVLWLVIAGSTRFLTVDEKAMISEPVSLSTSTLKQWSNGAFRTTDIAVGPVMRLLRSAVAMSGEQSARIAKALHWFFGFCMLAVLAAVLCTVFIRGEALPFRALFMGAALLMPTSATAFNMCNYDLFSMLLGALSLALAAAGFRRRNARILIGAMVIAAFAAQEKLIATPVLWFAMVLYVVFCLTRNGPYRGPKDRIVASLRAITVAFGCVAAVFLFSYSILILLHGGTIPVEYFGRHPLKIVLPLIAPVMLAIRGTAGPGILEIAETTFKQMPAIALWGLILSVTLLLAGLFALAMVFFTGNGVRRSIAALGPVLRRKLPAINYLLLVIVCGTGIASTVLVHGYWAPAHPVAAGHFIPGVSFNGATLHFGAQTAMGHYFCLFGWAYAVFCNAMPATIMALLLIVVPLRLIKKETVPLAFELMFSVCLAAPALYALAQIPMQNRYFNLFLLLVLIYALLNAVPLLSSLKPRIARLVALVALVLMAAELYPFRPAFEMFRPIWSDFGVYRNSRPVAGAVNPVGLGGGEEVMLAGEKIKRMYTGPERKNIRLYHNFYGAWLGDRGGISVLDMADHTVPLSYTGRDYYIVDRLSVVQDWLAFPDAINPRFTIGARGFAQAWVFRGDDLAGVRFVFPR